MGLEIAVIWFDDDVLEVCVRGGNGRFMGSAGCYVGHDIFPKLADAVQGFPTSESDRREFEIGTFSEGFAGGGVRISLRCIDVSGHAVVDLRIQSGPEDGVGGQRETGELSFRVEAAAIDDFVAALRQVRVAVGASVV